MGCRKRNLDNISTPSSATTVNLTWISVLEPSTANVVILLVHYVFDVCLVFLDVVRVHDASHTSSNRQHPDLSGVRATKDNVRYLVAGARHRVIGVAISTLPLSEGVNVRCHNGCQMVHRRGRSQSVTQLGSCKTEDNKDASARSRLGCDKWHRQDRDDI